MNGNDRSHMLTCRLKIDSEFGLGFLTGSHFLFGLNLPVLKIVAVVGQLIIDDDDDDHHDDELLPEF